MRLLSLFMLLCLVVGAVLALAVPPPWRSLAAIESNAGRTWVRVGRYCFPNPSLKPELAVQRWEPESDANTWSTKGLGGYYAKLTIGQYEFELYRHAYGPRMLKSLEMYCDR